MRIRRLAAAFFTAVCATFAILAAYHANAQSTAQPVVTGYLKTTGCPPGFTTCFQQFGSTGGGGSSVTATPDTHAQCSALCTSLVVKASAGVLKTFEVSADSTLSGATWYVLVYDATSKPADGAVTPAKCYQQASGTTQMGGTLGPGGTNYTTGITIAVSTTGCFTSTSSTHSFIGADFQ